MLLLSTYYASSDSVPSLRDLERYVSGELSAVEAQAFAEAMSEDPLLADAVEGLKEVRDPQALRKRIKQIQRLHQRRLTARLPIGEQQEERSKRKSRVRPMYIPQMLMGAVAVVLLLVLGFNLFRGLRSNQPEAFAQAHSEPVSGREDEPAVEQQLATSSDPAAEREAEDEADSSIVPPPSSLSLATPPPAATPKDPILPTPLPVGNSSGGRASIWRRDTDIDPSLEEEIARFKADDMASRAQSSAAMTEAVEEADLQREEKVRAQTQEEAMARAERPREEPLPGSANTSLPNDPQQSFAPEAATYSTQLAAEQAKASTQREDLKALAELGPQVQLAVARSHYQAQQWRKAEKELERILIQNPRSPEALFMLGDTYYRQGEIKDAMPYLLRVSAGAEPWYAQAQWTLALCAKAQGKTNTAIRLLKQLATRENLYQAAAQSLLNQWEPRP